MIGLDWLLLRDCEAILDRLQRDLDECEPLDLEESDMKLLRDLLNQAKAVSA